MRKPIFQNIQSVKSRYMHQFGGLSRTEEIAENEASDMKNGSSRSFPCFAPAKGRKTIAEVSGIECAISPRLISGEKIESFTGVASDRFYYNGEEKFTLTPQDRVRCLVDFNGNILIFPDKKYYSYVDDSYGEIAASVSGAVGFSVVSTDGAKENRIKLASGLSDVFKKGDSITIACTEKRNCTYQIASKYEQAQSGDIVSCVVGSVISDTEISVSCYDRDAEYVFFKEGTYENTTLSRAMPDIVIACTANNRVFGADQFGETIYASKLGDFKNWNVFEGLSTDSWYGSVGTEGPFTALCSLGSQVVAFKDNYIHQLYGETPNNFAIPKQIAGGCIDGRSVAQIRGQLFYLAHDGVYVFAGGNPVKISSALSLCATGGVGGTDGARYYISVEKADGTELLVYDAECDMWHKEDEFSAVSFIKYNDKLYAADENTLYEIGSGDTGEWFWQSKCFDETDMNLSAVVNLYVKAELKENSCLRVLVSCDGGDMTECAAISYSGRKAVRVPVRFRASESYQIRIAGKGDAQIKAIERVVYSGGRNETARV